jgi:dTDP-4-amino-4,6-dideoxygalactose transaminase
MSEPLVSVIIPSYNRPLLVRTRSIPSVLRQTFEDWEIVIVGDGPESAALSAVVDGFGDGRIRYSEITRPDYSRLGRVEFWNAAGAAARNHGLSLARGNLIAPLDDDDEFLPNHLGDCVAALGADRADFVYGKVVVRDFETACDHEDYFAWQDATTRDLFEQRNIMFHSSVCYAARYRNLRYPEDGLVPADYGLWKSIQQAGARFASLDSPQAIYYGDSLSGGIRVSMPTLPPYADFEDLLRKIYASRMLSNNGPVVTELEAALATFFGVPHAVTAPSGDVALILALRVASLRLPPGRREIVLPSYAHPSLINAALWNGLEPVLCDIDPDTLCMTPQAAAACLSPRTGIIAPLHPHGFPADMPALQALARRKNLMLLSDAAAALGASLHGRRIGTFGDLEVFSLSGTKTLTAGEGGVICCHDDELAADLRRLSRYGIGPDSQVDRPGINGKLAEIPAALALASLPFLDGWLTRRREMESRYRAGLAGLSGIRMIRSVCESAIAACKDTVLILRDPQSAAALTEHLAAYRITTRPYYRVLHRMPAYRQYQRVPLPITDRIADCTLCLPLYSDIRTDLVDFVVEAAREMLQ